MLTLILILTLMLTQTLLTLMKTLTVMCGDTVQWEIAEKGHYRAMNEISLKVIFFILFNTVLYFSSGEVKKDLPKWIETTGEKGVNIDTVSGIA